MLDNFTHYLTFYVFLSNIVAALHVIQFEMSALTAFGRPHTTTKALHTLDIHSNELIE